MGGQDNASTLIPAILGLGGNVTGIAVNRPGLGQPLTQFSQQMQERQLEQQRLQQQAAQEAVRREQTERRLNLQEQQQQAYLGALGQNQQLKQQSAKRQERQFELAQEEFKLKKQQAIEKANLSILLNDRINDMRKQGDFLSPQDRVSYEGMLAKGDIVSASNFLQKSDRYARIRALQDQGKLNPKNFDEQVRGLYPEFNKEQMKNFLPGARKTFIEDPGFFREKKLIPQTPTQIPTAVPAATPGTNTQSESKKFIFDPANKSIIPK